MFPSAMSIPSQALPSPTDALDSPEAGGRFIRGSFVRLFTFGLTVLASLISAPLVIRHLGPVDYGYFATVQAVVFIIGGFTEGGLNSLGIREFASGRSDRNWLLRNLVGLRVTGTAAGVAVAAIVAALAGAQQVIVYGLLLAGAGLIVTITGENYGIPLSSQLRITAVSLLGLAQQVALTICYVVLVVIGARTLPLLAATIISGAVLLGGTAFLVRGEVSIVPAFDRSQWSSMIHQTLPYAMATAVGIIYFREALVLISVLSTARQTGYYGAAFRIVEVLTLVPWQLVAAAFPIFSRAAHKGDDPRMAYALQRVFDTSMIVAVWMAASVLVGAAFAIAVVAGPAFRPSVLVLQIQGLAVVTNFMVTLFAVMLLSLRLFRPLLWANALAVAVATIASFALIPAYGARGAAIAPTAAEACLALAYAWSLFRARPALRVSLRLLPRVALAAALGLGVCYALPISSAARLFVFGALYFAALALLRAIPVEIVGAVLRRT
jgi:O-antigen/teichoic acid export membrane protein